MNKHASPGHLLLAIVISILWGLTFVFAKVGLLHFSPFFMLLLRFAIVALVLLPFYPKPPVRISEIVAIAFIFTIMHLGCMFWSLYLGLDSAVGVIAEQMAIPFVLLFGALFFKEKIEKKAVVGIFIAIIGTVVLVESPNSLGHPLAFALMIGSAFAWSLYSCALKKIKDVNPLALIAWISLFSIPMITPLTFFFEDNQMESIKTATLSPILSLFYTAILASIVAHGSWYYLLSHNPISKIAPVILLVPIFGVIGGALFLNEAMSKMMILGGVLMIVGMGIILIKKPRVVEGDIDI